MFHNPLDSEMPMRYTNDSSASSRFDTMSYSSLGGWDGVTHWKPESLAMDTDGILWSTAYSGVFAIKPKA